MYFCSSKFIFLISIVSIIFSYETDLTKVGGGSSKFKLMIKNATPSDAFKLRYSAKLKVREIF